jgi:hypothetical protein
MRLTRTSATELTITGNIKTTADYLAIRKLVTALVDGGASALSPAASSKTLSCS